MSSKTDAAASGVILLLMPVIVPVLAIISAAFGALAGWAVGLLFPDAMGKFAAAIGLEFPYQVGAVVGFLAAFLRSIVRRD